MEAAIAAPDFEAEGLLEGLEDERSREARTQLLRRLHDDGVSLDELRQAVAEERLGLLPAERQLGGEERHSARDIARETGVDLEFLRVVWQALGMPRHGDDEVAYSDEDLDAARQLKVFVDLGLPAAGIRDVARVLGSGTSQIADVTKSLVGEALLEPGTTELEVAERYAGAAQAMVPMAASLMEHAYKLHMREQLRGAFLRQSELESGRFDDLSETVTVLFADLVGFTKLGELLPPDELREVAGQLEEIAMEATESGVKLVKTIGDAVMLVGQEPPAVVLSALDLLDRVADAGEDFPGVRAGIDHGLAIQRGGDWYGRPVNTASRVTGIARPGSVLATVDVRDAAPDEFRWSAAGRKRMKGVKEPIALYRARRAGDGDESA